MSTSLDPLAARQLPVTLVQPTAGWRALDLGELWRYRELIYFLAWRDVKVRYKQTVFGVAWALLQPLLAMAVFTIFLGQLAKVPSDGVPYPLFAFAGLVPWLYFANATSSASGGLVANSHLITKVYFPRLALPLASVTSGLIDLGIGLGVLIVGLLIFGVAPGVRLLLVPALVGLAVLTALSVSVWFAALDAQYRDVRYAIPFLIQIWLFATPVVYPASLLPERWQLVYGLNPMAGVVEGFRWALLRGYPAPPLGLIALSFVVVLAILASGLYYFRRMERTFADVI